MQTLHHKVFVKAICVSSFCVEKFLTGNVFFATDFPLTVKAFWRAEWLRWVEKICGGMEQVNQCSDDMKTVEKNLFRGHVRRDGTRWGELGWGQARWEEIRWHEMRWSVECEVLSVKCEVWRVQTEVWKKCLLGVALQHGRKRVVFLDSSRQQRNKFAQSTHAQVWLAHGTCKFYQWDRSYSQS